MSTGTEPSFEELTSSSSQSSSGRISQDSFNSLLAITPTIDGVGGEVLETDTGKHNDATATGYDGPEVDNAGLYTWVLAWQRWQRMEEAVGPIDQPQTTESNCGEQDSICGHSTAQITMRDLHQAVWVTEDKVLFPRLRVDLSGTAPINTTGATVGGFELFDLETTGAATRFYWIDTATNAIESDTVLPDLAAGVVLLGSSRACTYTDCAGLPVVRRSEAIHQNNVVPKGVSRLLNGVISNASENETATQQITSTKWTEYSPRASGGVLRSTTPGAKIALTHLPMGYKVIVQDTVPSDDDADRVSVFVGHGRNNFAGGGGGLIKIDARYGAVEIVNVQEILYASPIGQFGCSQSPMLSFEAEQSILLAGQSFMVRFAVDGGVGGFTAGLRSEDGWLSAPIDESLRFIEGATGGSTVFKSEANGAQPFWVDDTSGDDPAGWVDGVAMTALRDALEAAVTVDGQPKPDTCFFELGASSMAAVQNGHTTVAKARDGYRWIWDAIRTDARTGADVQIIAAASGAILAKFDKGATGIRQAVLEEIAANTWAHQGPESYDLFRELDKNEVHLTKDAFWEWGRRWSRHYANVVHGQANNLGPNAAVALLADTTRAAVNVVPTGDALEIAARGNYRPDIMVADYPHGLGLLPAGSDAGEATPIAAIFAIRSATTASYDLQTTSDLTGARVIYPVGRVECAETGNFIHDSDGLPLRSFVSVGLQ